MYLLLVASLMAWIKVKILSGCSGETFQLLIELECKPRWQMKELTRRTNKRLKQLRSLLWEKKQKQQGLTSNDLKEGKKIRDKTRTERSSPGSATRASRPCLWRLCQLEASPLSTVSTALISCYRPLASLPGHQSRKARQPHLDCVPFQAQSELVPTF